MTMSTAPTAPVTSEQLAPPPDSQTAQISNPGQSGYQQPGYQQPGYQQPYPQQPGDPNQPQTQMAATAQQPQVSSVATTVAPPQKEDVLGQWRIADSFSTCQLNVSLTGWSGGYRASTRNCTSEQLQKIGAWNIEGNNVVLKDQSGQQIAVLARTGERRFDGALSAGGGVAMLR